MIRSHFGTETDPFDCRSPELLEHQSDIFETIKVHARQGGLCIVMGEPGTGKSVLKQAILDHDPKRMITPVVNRTLHTYSNTLAILCDAFGIEIDGRDTRREKTLIEAAWKVHANGRMLVPVIDDAHLLDIHCLRKLRLLFEDFPKSHCLLLVAQTSLIHKLRLSVNEDIRSRITFSAKLPRLNPDQIAAFIKRELDRAGLGHNIFDEEATELISRSSEGILRRVRNLCISALLEAVRDRVRIVGIDQVNRVLMQPHWRMQHDVEVA